MRSYLLPTVFLIEGVWGIPDEESKPVDGMDSHCINQPGSSKGQGGITSHENIHVSEL